MAWADVVNNLASNWANITNSYISTGNSMLSSTSMNYALNTNYEALFDFLKEYPFVVGIRDLLVSTIKEALIGTDFAVSSSDKSKEDLLKKYNERIKKMSFKNRILESLDDIVYRGVYLFGINEKGDRLFDVRDPFDIKVVKKRNQIVGYLYKGKFIKNTEAVTYYYRVDQTEVYSAAKAKKKKILIDDTDILESYEVGVTTFTGKSVFKSLLDRFYQIFIQDYMLYQLGLRESIRPEILSMVITGNRTNLVQATNAADNVERLLNQSSAALTSAVDPINFLNQITFFLLNNIKVVPQVDSFSNLSDIGVDSLVDKRRQLAEELEENKKQVLNTIGIPDELFSGSSNKWEVMSRNDRYATVTNNHLQAIANTVKRLVIALAAKDGVRLTEDELIFNLEVSSFLSTYESKSRLSALSDKLRELDSLVGTIVSLRDNDAINKELFQKYMTKTLGLLDADLANMIVLDKPKENKDSPGSIDEIGPHIPGRSRNIR